MPCLWLQEADAAEFDQKRKEAEEQADAKTVKNRAKRQKKKDRSKGKGPIEEDGTRGRGAGGGVGATDLPIKKRRLVSGKELLFQRREGDEEEAEDMIDGKNLGVERLSEADRNPSVIEVPQVVDVARITIHEDD